MKVLLDTHIALWTIATSARLSAEARELIAKADTVYVSVVSLWEIAIKRAVKPASMPLSAAEAWRYVEDAGYEVLPVLPAHTIALEGLPRHHGDPFDRMLVAQALAEPLRLITHDKVVAAYGDTIVLT